MSISSMFRYQLKPLNVDQNFFIFQIHDSKLGRDSTIDLIYEDLSFYHMRPVMLISYLVTPEAIIKIILERHDNGVTNRIIKTRWKNWRGSERKHFLERSQ